ncbi:proton-coupled amino acid transporter-like protein pathetic isoform X2 [Aricia agestis]|uniref:proton-coupled amino acid transporter-like protein pathetic isoform X2 n=1 Tax=Aricia agestis TaxID=91739 RepID=UPI001C20A0BC|nr:proton-coupled amino acid transporter-like protein pathetic isoform X2 [Aricia agestis]
MDTEKDVSSQKYNPFDHRDVKKPNSDIRSLANLLKASLGSGILAIPLAFANAGWGVGIVATIIIAIICAHCVDIFVSVSRGCCVALQKPVLNYADTCEAAFSIGPKRFRSLSRFAKLFAEFALLFTYLGVCCIFTVLISDSVKQLLDQYVQAFILPVQYYCLIFLVPLSLLVQIRYLKWLAPFSLLANLLLVAVFFICLYYIFRDPIVISDKRITGDIARFPAFLSPAICGKVFIAVSIFFTYPLHFYVVVDVLTRYVEPHVKESYRELTQTLLRIAIVWFCGGIAVALPMLEQIINIVGALFYSILGLIIPGVIETIFRWENLGKYKWVLWKNILIVLFGFLCLLSGCAVTIMDILKNLKKS